MKAIITTLLFNLGFRGAAHRDVLLNSAEKRTEVDAAIPSSNPTV